MKAALMPLVERTIRRNQVVLKVAGKATAMLRNLSLKPYAPKRRTREFAAAHGLPSLHAVRTSIFREKGEGTIPTIVIAGFVPDATEVIEFQRPLLKEFGTIYYLNYPRTGFSISLFFAQLADLVEEINRQGERPVLFGVSFGAGLIVKFMREAFPHEKLQIRGISLVSPVLCKGDLVRSGEEKGGGVRMLESNLRRILQARADDKSGIERQIERARRGFVGLFEAGADNRQLSGRHLAIRKKIFDVLEKTPAIGGYERVLALQSFQEPGEGPLFGGPVLTLLAEAEENLLVPTSPTLALCRDRERFNRLFPHGICRRVSSDTDNDPVAHASLIFHQQHYNPLLASWYNRLTAPKLFAAI